ncbi:formin-binding protein 1 isoform X1 [Centruroides vittatus]|uniref:formin-binding protein 1 isoform X1 n=1 Tax=Centruroides vittatus TaxID=120091 RepID=UPI00350FA835
MSWGGELWDQYDHLAAHTLRGIEFLEKYSQFIKDRCAIEFEYANKLKRLVKNYQPKKKDEEEYQFSSYKSFLQVMNEMNDIAKQHELIGENFTSEIVKEIGSLVKELKEERKKHLHDGSKLQTNLQASLSQLDKAKKAYEKAFKDAEKAHDNFQKADADLNLSRAEVEKARTVLTTKIQACEDSKTEYANQLQKTNDLQHQHYYELMPSVFQQLQDMDEKRITAAQNFMKQTADIQRQVFPIINQCLDGMIKAAESIDPRQDSLLVIEKHKTGYIPPEDFGFEDLNNQKSSDSTSNTTPVSTLKSETIKGTYSANKQKKRGGIFGIFSSNKHHIDDSKDDYSDLPPNQRKKKLQQKIEHINNQIQQESATREGLKRMKNAYEQNPALGNPHSLEGQLVEIGYKLEKLQSELQKYQTYLTEVTGKALTPTTQKRSRSSISEDSLSRSASDSSVTYPNNKNATLGALPPNGPESGLGTSHPSLPDADGETDVNADGEPEYDNGENQDFDLEPLPVLGTARALYPFEAQSEGSIPMFEGEEFEVVELDQGDGWTRVRRSNLEEGFVPTSYVECFLYNNC